MVLLFAGTPISAQRSKTRKKARQEQTIKTPTPKWAAGTTTKQKKVLRELINNMVFVKGGTFTMGATAEQIGYGNNETPAHQVTLSDYFIGKTEVTQELWYAVMGNNPSYFTRSSRNPVEQVSWHDCQSFIQKLNQLTGLRFRLPTEAEWEYAARGGNKSKGYKYSGSNNIGDVAWCYDNSSETTHEVGTKAPNELGLYDMSGNVWEWCSDWYGRYSSSAQSNPTGPSSGSFRVFRGGSWIGSARALPCGGSQQQRSRRPLQQSRFSLSVFTPIGSGIRSISKLKTFRA